MAEQNSSRPANSPSPRKKRKKTKRIAGRIFKVIATLLLICIITGSFLACFAAVYIQQVIIPQVEFDMADFPMDLSSTIYYTDPETGEVLEYETLSGDQNRIYIKYDDIPKNLVYAVVAIEDRRFYEHNGVDWLSTAKGIFNFFTGGKIRGGSTITQQMIKNSTQHDEVTVKRKILEIFTALDVDKRYSKEQILEQYLNVIYFGRKCYGVATASYKYFGKDVTELSLAECASLISITNNPSLYDPYTHPENNKERRGYVLDGMVRDGKISQEECDAAKAEELDFRSAKSNGQESALYSWYTEQVITDVLNDLKERYGYSDTVAERTLYAGGLRIFACVDTNIQAIVDEVYSNVENLPYTSRSGQQLQSAITIVDEKGNVVALAGKLGEKVVEDTRGYNMATAALRQPGSVIKPLAVYAPGVEMGLITPYTVFEDSPVTLINETTPWPSNENERYKGQTTVLSGISNSTNTIAVRIMEEVTPEASYEYLVDKFGIPETHLVEKKIINGKEFSDIGLAQLALGGLTHGVSTLDMAAAYSVFPRNGIYVEPRTYSRVEDANGKVILENTTEGEPVLKETTVYYMNQMLNGVMRSGTGTVANFSGMTLGGKTGTTTANNDRWFVGYSPYYTAAVWVGYQRPETVRVKGSNPAALLWKQVMSKVHEGLEDKSFPRMDGLVSYEYCLDTGLRATDACRADIRGDRTAVGRYFEGDVPVEYCEAHVMVDVCTADPILEEEGKPTGRYHLAGEFCPDSTVDENGNEIPGRIQISVVDMERKSVSLDVTIEDNVYFLAALNEAGPCTVHTEEIPVLPEPYDPSQFDITNPSTWPSLEDYPDFDPADASTWPTASPPPIEPDVTPSPAETLPVTSWQPTFPPEETVLPPEETKNPPEPTQTEPIAPEATPSGEPEEGGPPLLPPGY